MFCDGKCIGKSEMKLPDPSGPPRVLPLQTGRSTILSGHDALPLGEGAGASDLIRTVSSILKSREC